jgi:hypothetical protein
MLQSKTSTKAKLLRAERGVKKPGKGEKSRTRPARDGTKQEAVLALLRQPLGATVDAMMKATGWHSIRCAASLPAWSRRAFFLGR